MKMKKVKTLILACVLVFSMAAMAGCGSKDTSAETEPVGEVSEEESSETEEDTNTASYAEADMSAEDETSEEADPNAEDETNAE